MTPLLTSSHFTERLGAVTRLPLVGLGLDALEDAGIPTVSSCAEGTCGTCETRVVEGIPDHRDSVLSAQEREENDCMMICVSRSCTATLVLDL